jgi:pyridoxal biosynthesis lyase PdxS
MALERVPADIRRDGGVARMSDPQMIREIMDTVTIPVMAKARIGHFVECQVGSHIPSHTTPSSPIPPKTYARPYYSQTR